MFERIVQFLDEHFYGPSGFAYVMFIVSFGITAIILLIRMLLSACA